MKEQLARAEAAVAALRETRNDRWYPTFHIAAPAGWINDPNGLSFFKDRYQVYFQHHPYSTQWGPMHWGHVSSTDMVTWKREPIAFAPSIEADRDGVFSGSAVPSPDGETLYVYYTGHRWANGVNEDDGNDQVQCMATSTDGINFEKHGVVVEGPAELPHFRDPKVWQIGDTWYMVFGACSADNRGQVWLYTSTDMEDWEFDSILFEDPDP
ncbi:MAG: glycoside hydrolase family 32 protein, partial [Ancrocorticia populi]